MAAGAYNLSMTIGDSNYVGWGSGSARTFPVQIPNGINGNTNDLSYSYQYLYDATLSGTPYNFYLLPAVSSISPAMGSVAGGTVLTITGTGFSNNVSRNVVYAGGQPCTVISADFTSLQCVTSPVTSAAFASFVSKVSSDSNSAPSDFKKNSNLSLLKI